MMKKDKFQFRTVLSIILTILVSTSFIGCSGANISTSTTKSSSTKPVVISMMSWLGGSSTYYDGYQEAIKEYTKLHPNVTIKYIYQPMELGGYTELLDTEFLAHNAPDIIHMQPNMISTYANKDDLLPLDPYMNETTPYNGNQKWIDTFIGGSSSFVSPKASNKYGAIMFVPMDGAPGVSMGQPIFYNKTLFKNAGINQAPKNWKEFMDDCSKLKSAGTIPISADNGRWVSWVLGDIGGQFGEGYLNKFFDQKYASPNLMDDKSNLALFEGKINSSDPIQSEILSLTKDFSQYWEPGWTGTSETEAQQLFMYGKTAMIQDGNWQWSFYNTAMKGFQWGTFSFPLVTKATSSYAEEAYSKAGTQQDYGFALNKDLEKDPAKLKTVVDFWQFVTSKDFQNKYVDIAKSLSPIIGVHVSKDLKTFISPTDKATLVQPVGSVIYNYGDSSVLNPLMQEFLTGKMSVDAIKKDMDENDLKVSKQYIIDKLDPKLGYQVDIAAAQKSLSDLKSTGSSQILIDSQQQTLDTLKSKLDLLKTSGLSVK